MSPPARLRTANLVIGSGPGGCTAASLLAEAGREVIVLEDGPFLSQRSCAPFSADEMIQKYRHGGLTVTLGSARVAYVEGRCVGGGSEINSGLHHRTPPEVLAEWQKSHDAIRLTERDLQPHFEGIERDLNVSGLPGPAPAASRRLVDGARALGWRSLEVPRWFRYIPSPGNPLGGIKQSMTETYVLKAQKQGATLWPETRARYLEHRNGHWRITCLSTSTPNSRRETLIEAENVFVACGTIQSALLLQRSGIAEGAGRRFHLHPTIKVVAEFSDEVNAPDMGVPTHQVKEFSPRLSFGCSISTPPHLALALLHRPAIREQMKKRWRHMAIYYAMTRGGLGSIRPVPFFNDPLVRYHLADEDWRDLADGLRKLCECLFAAGATALYPAIQGVEPFYTPADLERLPQTLTSEQANLMTIHLFSSCPLGEAPHCVTDSFGKVRDVPSVFVVDGSLLPGAPGVNPQGTIMALVRRNIIHFLEQ